MNKIDLKKFWNKNKKVIIPVAAIAGASAIGYTCIKIGERNGFFTGLDSAMKLAGGATAVKTAKAFDIPHPEALTDKLESLWNEQGHIYGITKDMPLSEAAKVVENLTSIDGVTPDTTIGLIFGTIKVVE